MSLVVEKMGVLRKNTMIYTEGAMTFNVEKGTIVIVAEGELRFQGKDITAQRRGEAFYVRFSSTWHRVVFPDGGVPYPFTML